MNGTQPWYASRGVWGGIVTIAVAGISFAHYSITPSDQATATDLLTAIGSSVGGLLALWGRIAATKQIGGQS